MRGIFNPQSLALHGFVLIRTGHLGNRRQHLQDYRSDFERTEQRKLDDIFYLGSALTRWHGLP